MHRVRQQQGVTTIELGPSYAAFDTRALEELGELLLAETTYADPPRLIVDMAPTHFVSSIFIELMVRAWKRIKRRNGAMALCAPQPFCLEVLQVSRLDTIWPIFSTHDEAFQALSNSAATG